MSAKLLTMLFLAFSSVSTFASTIEIEGLYYDLNEETHTAVITGCNTNVTGTVIIPSNVNVSSVIYAVSSIAEKAFYNNYRIEGIFVSEGVISIGNDAFCGCSKLTTALLPNSINTIGNGVFCNCHELNSVTLPQDVIEIPRMMFYGCDHLSEIEFPVGVRTISYGAFGKCGALLTLALPDGLESIGQEAFCESGLASIHFPTSLKSLSYDSFSRCQNLIEVFLPTGLTGLPESCFRSCRKLAKVYMPSTMTFVDKYVFAECTALKDVYVFAPTLTQAKSKTFDGTPTNEATLHVPAQLIESYKVTAPWIDFGHIVALTDEEIASDIETSAVSDDIQSYYFSLNGKALKNPQKGLNVLKRNGRSKIIIVK